MTNVFEPKKTITVCWISRELTEATGRNIILLAELDTRKRTVTYFADDSNGAVTLSTLAREYGIADDVIAAVAVGYAELIEHGRRH